MGGLLTSVALFYHIKLKQPIGILRDGITRGSTFKIVTALAYLRQNQTVDGFSFDCEGELTSGNYTLHCAGNSVHGQQDFYEAFANSCNTAFATIGLSLDKGGFQTLADSLYLNSRLDLELPTSRSRFSVDSSTAEALMMQTSIGQGNTVVTPMEMALITAAVANDGVMMKPYFVDRGIRLVGAWHKNGGLYG